MDLEMKKYRDKNNFGCACISKNEEMVRKLLNSGEISVNEKLHDGNTPLTLSVIVGALNIVEILLNDYDADVNFTFRDKTPIQYASYGYRKGFPEMMDLLLKFQAIHDRDNILSLCLEGKEEIEELLNRYTQYVPKPAKRN